MLSKKLITLLQTFSKQDLQQFDKYVRSPFFNEQEELVRLFELINVELAKPVFELTKQAAWKKLFGNKAYKDVFMRRLNSELTRLAEGYLVQRGIKKKPICIERPLAQKALNISALEKHFIYLFRFIERMHEKSEIRNLDYYWENFQLYEEARLFNEDVFPKLKKLLI